MSQISVLIVVDTEGATTSGSLQNNVYLVDTNKYMGSWGEGGNELQTACHDGDVISWAVAPIDPNADVEINSFTGTMINDKICVPTKQGIEGAYTWEGRVEAQGTTGEVQYSCVLSMDGVNYTFDPYLNIS